MNTAERSEFLVRHLTQFLRKRAEHDSPLLDRITERLVRQTVDGHIAISLGEQPDDGSGADMGGPTVSQSRNLILGSGIVGKPGSYYPLILDDANRLYLYRYWNYEQRVANLLRERATRPNTHIDATAITKRLASLFPGANESAQKTAAAIAALKYLTVVSGGPGTGKTTAVVRILALLLEMKPDLDIAVAAPTGKAAARASDAVRSAGATLSLDEKANQRIPRDASTIHRLLGLGPGFSRYHADNQLPHDVVVVDEASMIGVALMARLLDALRPDCRLILLGDKDQLSSVEPGSVLGDICSVGNDCSTGFAAQLKTLGVDKSATTATTHALQDNVVRLDYSFRFDAQSGIGRLAAAIRRGDSVTSLTLLNDSALPEIQFHAAASTRALHESLAPRLLKHLRTYIDNITAGVDATKILSAFDSFRLLCALRDGQTGVSGLNALAEQVLAHSGLIDTRETWYTGRPVMVSSNDYMLQLFNGDIGVTIRDPDDDSPRVVFESQDGLRSLHTPRLPAHATVFAMTVHKAQGSEFDDVILVLPDEPGELLSRELIYTAVTRARNSVTIYGRPEVLQAAITRIGQRESGLADKLRISRSGDPEQGTLF